MDVYTGMVLAGLIFLASLISVELGISAAIIEIVLGVVAGNVFGIQQMTFSPPSSCTLILIRHLRIAACRHCPAGPLGASRYPCNAEVSLDKTPEMVIMASLTPQRRDLWN